MTDAGCTAADHEAIKLDTSRWSLLRLDGYQTCEQDEFGPALRVEVRTCGCGSTLGVEI